MGNKKFREQMYFCSWSENAVSVLSQIFGKKYTYIASFVLVIFVLVIIQTINSDMVCIQFLNKFKTWSHLLEGVKCIPVKWCGFTFTPLFKDFIIFF